MSFTKGRDGTSGLSRRDFLKASAAATAATTCGLAFAYDPGKAAAYEGRNVANGYQVLTTTCPYCSASCGQRVVVARDGSGNPTQTVVDIYGDPDSPMNSGGLCSKGAGSLELVNNTRRIGAWTGTHPVNPVFAARAETKDGALDRGIDDFRSGVAYRRSGNDDWTAVGLDYAMDDIGTRLVAARASDATGWNPGTGKYNSKSVAFFGSSHINNEPGYVYRKLIAAFGTSNVEHQARICHSTTVAGLAPAFARGAMSNNWSDMGNATLLISMGGNPAENHPAAMNHINVARRGPHSWTDGEGNTFTSSKPAAKLVVIEPRITRTALQADHFVRIRPGTDIAFINGVINYIINSGLNLSANANRKVRFKAFHEASIAGRKFIADGDITATTLVGTWPRYSDASFKVVAASATNADYERAPFTDGAKTFANMPVLGASYDAAGTVFDKLKAHVAPYTVAVTADICGCRQSDISLVGNLLIEHSRMASVATDTDAFSATVNDPKSAAYRATTFMYAMGLTQHTNGSMNVKSFATIQTLLGNMGRAGGGINAMRGIHNVQGSTDMGLLYHLIPGYSGNPGATQSYGAYADTLFGNRLGAKTAATLAVGAGDAAVLYTARYGGTGGNSLRVAHVASSPNQALGVAVSGNDVTVTLATDGTGAVTSTAAAVSAAVNAFAAAKLVLIATNPGTGADPAAAAAITALSGGAVDYTAAYTFANHGLQQKGFWNMTKAFFGDSSYRTQFGVGYEETLSALAETQANVDALYALWPKGNGDNQIRMIRKMQPGYAGADKIKAAVVWGQNPAVTYPNQAQVRDGLKELDLLVCTDIFENETAYCDRKTGGVTYLIPACSHVEEAGTAANSGRVLQWRYQSVKPQGNSKTDMELLFRLAYSLDAAGGFAHIRSVWTTLGIGVPAVTGFEAAQRLFGDQYGGWTPGAVFDSELVAGKVHKQMCAPQNNGGTIWIYLEAWDTSTTSRGGGWPTTAVINGVSLPLAGIRAKSRRNYDLGSGDNPATTANNGNRIYKNWGYSWLVNRRVLYSDGNVGGDQTDTFQSPELVARLFVSTNTNVIDYGQSYRTVHRMADKPLNSAGAIPAIHVLPGRFPAHTEPYESPRADLVATWGKNSSTNTDVNLNSGYENLIYKTARDGFSETKIGTVADFPLVLTTFRCVEHFQGGVLTRNNWLNSELEPEPWIDINSVDARKYGIRDGDMVKIVTARTDVALNPTFTNSEIESVFPRALYGDGFRARVGAGLSSSQRIGPGVVGIPFHWGDRGLSTGSRANDLTIDAGDANTTMPEYKACLCRIEKIS
jgi:anaerobic selenocysteine-containing dehydrogenase